MFAFFRRNANREDDSRAGGGGEGRGGQGRSNDAEIRNEGPTIPGFDPLVEFLNNVTRGNGGLGGGGGLFEAAGQHRATKDPPASAQAVRTLPIVTVMPENLVDEINRECCICFESNELGDKVLRLPCAHIFHPSCIVDWVKRHCTCPICRYELPTDDPQYEVGRRERMKKRKPRYARYELEQMPVQRLRELAGTSRSFFEKAEIIDFLISSDKVEIVKSPPPVEYKLSELRAMKVGELKRTMESAGVFYFSHEIVEKEDLITVFQNSGRLAELPETKVADDERTDDDNSNGMNSKRLNRELKMMIGGGSPEKTRPTSGVLVETVEEEDENMPARNLKCHSLPSGCLMVERLDSDSNEAAFSVATDIYVETGTTILDENFRSLGTASIDRRTDQVDLDSSGALTSTASSNEPGVTIKRTRTGSYSRSAAGTSITESVNQNFRRCTISDLLDMGRKANLDLTACCERDEMIEIIVGAGIESPDNIPLIRPNFSGWGVSQLRALASVIDLDLPEHINRNSMIDHFLIEANNYRLHLRDYLRALTPLARLSLPELRAFAREQNIDISNCIEKEEIILRLMVYSVSDGVSESI